MRITRLLCDSEVHQTAQANQANLVGRVTLSQLVEAKYYEGINQPNSTLTFITKFI